MYAVLERSSGETFQSSFASQDSYTMGQQHRPVFRKRSLAELPGNIRVPVFKKPDRLKSRLEASLAGLRELQSLREKHQTMVNEAMTSLQSPTFKQNEEDTQAREFPFEIEDNKYGATEQASVLDSYLKPRSSISEESNSASVSDTLKDEKLVEATSNSRYNSKDCDGTEKQNDYVQNYDNKGSESNQNNIMGSDESDNTIDKSLPTTVSEKHFRPRSMSLSHFPSSRKNPVDRSSSSVNRASTDALPSTEGTGSSRKRKGSIFEGVDINIKGPNPVHAILMQYGPLPSTQSMPSVCPNIIRRHSGLPPKTDAIRFSQSDKSSSTNSVFSTTDTVTNTTQNEDIPKKESVDTKKSMPRFLETDIDLVMANEPIIDIAIQNCNLKKHKKCETPNVTSTNNDSNESTHSIVYSDISLKNVLQEAKRKENRTDSCRQIAHPRVHHSSPGTQKDKVPKPHFSVSTQPVPPKSEHVTQQIKCEITKERNCGVETSRNTRMEDRSRNDIVSTVQRECPVHLKNSKNSENKEISNSINNTNSRLTRSTSNITNTHRRDLGVISVSCNKTSTLPYQSIQSLSLSNQTVSTNLAGDNKKTRRFGMPLDSKLIPSMLCRQDKIQPIRKVRREVVSAPSVNSLSDWTSIRGKENSGPLRQSSYTPESSLDDDDEYGMTRLLEPRRRLTSTPVLSTRRSSTLPRPSCVSDEGYSPSRRSSQTQGHRGLSNRHHKISIKSDRTWISLDLEDSGMCSGELSPCSPISPSGPRFNFSDLPGQGHGFSESCSNSVIHCPARSSPDWDSFSHRSSVSVLSLSRDVQESSL